MTAWQLRRTSEVLDADPLYPPGRRVVVWSETSDPVINWWKADVSGCSELCSWEYSAVARAHADVLVLSHGSHPDGVQRTDRQLIAGFAMEEYHVAKLDRSKWDLTMTYELDSDVPVTYVPPYELYMRPAAFEHATSHPRPLVSWVASKCITKSNRTAIAQAFLDAGLLESYGNCLNTKALPSTASPREASKAVDAAAFPQYFLHGRQDTISKLAVHHDHPFALVMENTIAPAYVTEKVFHALAAGVVPIYFGTADIDFYVPQGSIIKAADFGGDHAALVAHVRAIAADPHLYQQYHVWRQQGERSRPALDHLSSVSTAACRLCWAVHSRRSLSVLVPERDRDYAQRPLAFNLHAGLIAHGVLHTIHIVRQADSMPFNRGRLLNVGTLLSQASPRYGRSSWFANDPARSRVCFNDIDAVPDRHGVQASRAWRHYLHRDRAATVFGEGDDIQNGIHSFGAGVACMPRQMLHEVNGWSNQMWGWGVEDRNFHARVIHHNASFLGYCGVNSTMRCITPSEKSYKSQLRVHLFAAAQEVASHARDGYRKNKTKKECLWQRSERLHVKQTGAHQYDARGRHPRAPRDMTLRNPEYAAIQPDARSAARFPLLDDGLSTCTFTLLLSRRVPGSAYTLHTVDLTDDEAHRAVQQCP